MTKEHLVNEKENAKVTRHDNREFVKHKADSTEPKLSVSGLQNLVGNRAVQRLLAKRSGDSSFELDDDTAGRINRARGGGQELDGAVQKKMGQAMGQDFSGVRAHTSPEADDLNHQLGAKAFTTGQDIFFREGAYKPNSSNGEQLIAHELTHVAQQSSGAVGGGGWMKVNAPGDAFEQEADTVAKAVTAPVQTPGAETVQRQEMAPEPDEDEDALQMQTVDENELEDDQP